MNKKREVFKWIFLLVVCVVSFALIRKHAEISQESEEIVATFDNGIGGVDTMTRKGKALTLKVSSKSAKIENIE